MEFKMSQRYSGMLTMIILWCCCIFAIFTPQCFGADPVLTPQVVTDSYGNTANNASVIHWAPLPSGLPYETSLEYDDGGLTPLYNFAKHFVNTVQPNPFPYGEYHVVLLYHCN